MRCKCRVCYARRLSGERRRSCANYNPALSSSGAGAGCSTVTVCSLPLTDLPDNQPRLIVTAGEPLAACTGGNSLRTHPAKIARSPATSLRDISMRNSPKPPGRHSAAALAISFATGRWIRFCPPGGLPVLKIGRRTAFNALGFKTFACASLMPRN